MHRPSPRPALISATVLAIAALCAACDEPGNNNPSTGADGGVDVPSTDAGVDLGGAPDTSADADAGPAPADEIHCLGVAGGTNDNKLWVLTQDENHNTLLVGHFWGSIELGDFSSTASDLNPDAFIALANPDCEIEWATFGIGAGSDRADDTVPLPDGRIAVVGGYQNEVRFSDDVALSADDTNERAFLLVLDADGTPQSAIDFPGAGNTYPHRVDRGPDGSIYVSVSYDVDLTEFPATSTSGPDYGRAILRVSASGAESAHILRARAVTGFCNHWGNAVNADTGQMFLSGGFQGICDVGGEMIESVSDDADAWIASFDADGNPVWVHTYSGGISDFASNITVEPTSGDILVTGRIAGAVDFGDGDTSFIGGQDAFVVRLDGEDGSVVWRRILGGNGDDFALVPELDAERGQVLVSGNFEGRFELDDLPALQSEGGRDGFYAAFDLESGDALWTRRFGGDDDEWVYTAMPAPEGQDVLLSGEYVGDTVEFFGDDMAPSPSTTFFWSRATLR